MKYLKFIDVVDFEASTRVSILSGEVGFILSLIPRDFTRVRLIYPKSRFSDISQISGASGVASSDQ